MKHPRGTISHYNQLAADYEKRWSAYLRHTHQEFLNRIRTSAGDVLLDPSCGTGLLARELIDDHRFPFKKLLLNDPSDEMLSIARNRLKNEQEKVSFYRQQAENLDFVEQTINRILCLNAFHYYREQETVCRKWYRMLKDGGTVYLLDWNRDGWFRLANRIIEWWTPEEIHTRSKNEAVELLEDAGFSLLRQESWYFRYWNLFFIAAQKP